MPMQDPVALSCCGRTFSRKPLISSLQANATCPTCRKPAPSVEDVRGQVSVLFVKDMVGSLTVLCPFGCRAMFPRNRYNKIQYNIKQ